MSRGFVSHQLRSSSRARHRSGIALGVHAHAAAARVPGVNGVRCWKRSGPAEWTGRGGPRRAQWRKPMAVHDPAKVLVDSAVSLRPARAAVPQRWDRRRCSPCGSVTRRRMSATSQEGQCETDWRHGHVPSTFRPQVRSQRGESCGCGCTCACALASVDLLLRSRPHLPSSLPSRRRLQRSGVRLPSVRGTAPANRWHPSARLCALTPGAADLPERRRK